MLEQRSNMDRHGRLLIPYTFRKKLNYKSGDTFLIRLINDEMHIVSIDKVLTEARTKIKNKIGNMSNILDDFMQMRKQEAVIENTDDYGTN